MLDLRSLIRRFRGSDRATKSSYSESNLKKLENSLTKMKTGGGKGRPKPHKALMLLAVLDLFDTGDVIENRIFYDQKLVSDFTKYFNAIARPNDRCRPETPFFHLASSNFWRHKVVRGQEAAYSKMKQKGTWPKKIMQTIDHAYLENHAFAVLSDPDGRKRIRDFILETFFSAEEREKLREVMNGRDGVIEDGSLGTDSPQLPEDEWTPLLGVDDPVESLPLSRHAINSLMQNDIRTLGALLDLSVAQIMAIKNVEEQTSAEILAFVEKSKKGTFKGVGAADPAQSEDLVRQDGWRLSAGSPLAVLGLSARTYNVLQRGGISTVGEFMAKSDQELRAIRNVGNKVFGEIQQFREGLASGIQPSSEEGRPSQTPELVGGEEPAEAISSFGKRASKPGHLPAGEIPDNLEWVSAWPEHHSQIKRELEELNIANNRDLLNTTMVQCVTSKISIDDWTGVFVVLKSCYQTSILRSQFPMSDTSGSDLHQLGISPRVTNALRRVGITRIGQVLRLTLADLIAVRYLGEGGFSELLTRLRAQSNVVDDALKGATEARGMSETLTEGLAGIGFGFVIDRLVQAGIREPSDFERWTFEELISEAKLTFTEAQHVRSGLRRNGFSLSSELPEDALAHPEDLAYLKRLGIPLDQIGIVRLSIPPALARNLSTWGLNTVDELAGTSKAILEELLGEKAERWLGILTANLSAYLDHVSKQTQWDSEITGEGPSPVAFIRLKETTLEVLMDRLLSCIRNSRGREMLGLRHGLSGDKPQTLSEIADRFELTRERVRQIERRAFAQLQVVDKPLLSAMLWSVEREMTSRGGLMSLAQIGEHVETLTEIGEVDRDGALGLLLELHGSTFHKAGQGRWLLSGRSEDLVSSTERELVRILETGHAPLPFDQLYVDLCNSEWCGRHEDPASITRQWVVACLSANEQFEEREDGMWGLSKWGRSYTDEIILALRQLGEPAHYTEIARVANELLPSDERVSARNVHVRLQQKSRLFVRTGAGVYGLSEWGLGRVRFYKVIVREYLERKGEPQPLEAIAAAVGEERPFSSASLSLLLSTNPEFKACSGGRFGLAAWSERDTESEESAEDDFIKGLKDRLFSDLLDGKG